MLPGSTKLPPNPSTAPTTRPPTMIARVPAKTSGSADPRVVVLEIITTPFQVCTGHMPVPHQAGANGTAAHAELVSGRASDLAPGKPASGMGDNPTESGAARLSSVCDFERQ